jgi:hypothetical protein
MEKGFRLDEDKTEITWFFSSGRPGHKAYHEAKQWKLDWWDVHRSFHRHSKPMRWLGFYLDPRLDWRDHTRLRLALGHHRIATASRVMKANGVPRRIARKIGWSLAMSAAAYGMEVIWKSQPWILKGFDKLTLAIARAVAGTFGTTAAGDTILATDSPPAGPALDRRRHKFLLATLSAADRTPRRTLLPPSPNEDSDSEGLGASR